MSEPRPPVSGDDPEHEFQDPEISRLYQNLSHPRPSAETDAEILTVARRVVDAPFLSRYVGWRSGLATAAVLVLVVGLLRFWMVDQGRRVAETPAAEPAAAPTAAETEARTADSAAAPPAGAPAPDESAAAAPPQNATAPAAQMPAAKAAAKPESAAPAENLAEATPAPQTEMLRPVPKPKPRLSYSQPVVAAAPQSQAAATAAAAAPAAAKAAPIVDSAVAGAILQHQPSVHELMSEGRYDAAYDRAKTAPAVAPWSRLDSDLLGLLTGKPAEQHCVNNTADSVVNDACSLLHSYREGKTVSPEDVKAMGIAIKRYSPEHQYWFNGLQDLLKR